ncbi:hypothetical protein EDB83DRAFT_2333641 [Lactarius deliciosus]|nr:hypothetical protein EDB83DRAFT_2333641 [Lactarius deliciosus]
MPGLTPVRLSANTLVVHHDSAADFLSATFPTLRRHEESANIVFAHAFKLLGSEAALTGFHFTNESDVSSWWKQRARTAQSTVARPRVKSNEPFWLTVCGTLGDYPIFLWTPKTPTPISQSWLTPRTELLAEHLLDIVPPQAYWSDLVKCAIEQEPFYSAYYTYCNLDTFKEAIDPVPSGDKIRRAGVEDLAAVAQLCKEFADESVYFPLEIDAAMIEARELTAEGLIWIYESEGEVTSICAVTRSTQNVSAITKVFTTPKWRRRGFAEHLVRNITKRFVASPYHMSYV